MRGMPGSGSAPVGSGFGDFFGTEMAPEGFRNKDAAVRLLIRFEERDVDAREGCARAIESVAEAVFPIGVLVAQVKATGLKVLEVGAAGDFEVTVLAGSPDFDIVGFCAAEPQITGAKLNDPIMESKELEDFFGIRGEGFEFGVGGFRSGHLDEFDLVELMNADQAARSEPGGTRFAPEARGIGDVFLREIGNLEDFLAMEIGDWDLGGRSEVKFVALTAVELLFELRQLTGADEGVAPDDERRADFRVAMLTRVQVEHEVD